MATSANALYVLRLVLGGPVRRTFFTSTAPRQRALGLPPGATWPTQPQTPTVPTTPTPSFLEADETDYAEASEFLPDRESKEPSPVPWPTVFRHEGEPKPHQPLPCDLVARLAASQKLGPARKVAEELKALHWPITHRKLYLDAALGSLNLTEEGRRNFLFWLALYPNRPATLNTPTLRDEWEPVAYRLIAEHIDDPKFLGEFLILAGRKGLLNVVFPILITPLVAVMPPQESEVLVERALDAFRATCRPSQSNSRRARYFRRLADKQVEQWWNKYLRTLVIVGHTESAYALLHSPPTGVRFSSFTRSITLGHSITKRIRADEAHTETTKVDSNDPLMALVNNPPPGHSLLAQQIARALDRTQLNLPLVAELAYIQRLLLLERPDLLATFEERFLARRADSPTPVDVRFQWWAHAEILRLARDGNHAEAVKTFRRRFLWVGLPPIWVGTETLTPAARRLPTQRVITTLIPSILALLSPNERETYLVAYYNAASQGGLARTLAPNEYTHLAFVRAASLTGGPAAATGAMKLIADKGYDPGRPAWTVLLLNLMGQRQAEAAFSVLSGMERRAPFGTSGFRMPTPNGRTYAGLVRLCVNHGRVDDAVNVLRRFRKYVRETGEGADEAADLGRTESFLANVKRSGSKRSAEAIAEDIRTRTQVKLELDRLEGEDVSSRMWMMYERKSREDWDGEVMEAQRKEGVVSEAEGAAGEEKRVVGEERRAAGEEKESAFA